MQAHQRVIVSLNTAREHNRINCDCQEPCHCLKVERKALPTPRCSPEETHVVHQIRIEAR